MSSPRIDGEKDQALPFIVNFIGSPDVCKFKGAVRNLHQLSAAYDEQNQVSGHVTSSGTQLTYRRTGIFNDDTEVDDT